MGKTIKGDLSKNWKQLQKDVPALGQAMSALTNPLSAVAGGLIAVGGVIKASVGDWVAYNKEIREMTQTTGLGAEEISRIVQVGDDWGVSIDALRTSLAFMNKSGVTPSIDNLAKLADEYVASKNKSAWAAEAVKTLGRGYETLIPILAKGGDALRAQTEAVDESLLATEESIAASREYELAVDELGDSWTGVKNTIGQAVVPVLNDLLGAINDTKTALDEQKDVTDEYYQLLEAGIIVSDDAAESTNGYERAMRDGKPSVDEMRDAVEKAKDALQLEGEKALAAAQAYEEKYNPSASEAMIASQKFGDMLNTNTSPALDTIAQKLGDADALMQAYNNKLIYNAISANLTAEQQVILAEKMGLIDDATYLAYAGVESLNKIYDLNKDGAVTGAEVTLEYLDALAKWQGQMEAIPDNQTKNSYINTYYTDYYNAEYGSSAGGNNENKNPGKAQAQGADYIIPPGYSDDSYPLGTGKSGERVIVIPKGEAGNSTTNNFNMQVHTNAGVSTLQRDFSMMKAMAG
jgi:hypothetical protein